MTQASGAQQAPEGTVRFHVGHAGECRLPARVDHVTTPTGQLTASTVGNVIVRFGLPASVSANGNLAHASHSRGVSIRWAAARSGRTWSNYSLTKHATSSSVRHPSHRSENIAQNRPLPSVKASSGCCGRQRGHDRPGASGDHVGPLPSACAREWARAAGTMFRAAGELSLR